jgi:hypothetical protein
LCSGSLLSVVKLIIVMLYDYFESVIVLSVVAPKGIKMQNAINFKKGNHCEKVREKWAEWREREREREREERRKRERLDIDELLEALRT